MDRFEEAWLGNESSLVNLVTEKLRNMIIDGKILPGYHFPNESEFASKLKISRSTLRSAYDNLEKVGYIVKKRGIGTFVSDVIPSVNNLNVNSGVTEVIRSSGAKPGALEIAVSRRPAGEHVANQLRIEEGSPVIIVERVRTANNRRVTFSIDYLPETMFCKPDEDISLDALKNYLKENQSMYEFLSNVLSMKTGHSLAWLRPINADVYLSEKLLVERGSGLLLIEQVDFDFRDNAFALSEEYYVPNAFTFTVYRSQF